MAKKIIKKSTTKRKAIMQERPSTIDEAYINLKPMIISQANRFAKNRRDMFEDYFQEGAIGLTHAYNRYNPDAGMAFSSYAYMWIFTCIKDVAIKNWAGYNRESSKEITDSSIQSELQVSDADMINSLAYAEIETKLTGADKLIFRGRLEGKTFAEIAEDLKAGKTLHQVRSRWLEISSDVASMLE